MMKKEEQWRGVKESEGGKMKEEEDGCVDRGCVNFNRIFRVSHLLDEPWQIQAKIPNCMYYPPDLLVC